MSSSSNEDNDQIIIAVPSLSKLSPDQVQSAKIITYCLSPLSLMEFENFTREAPSLITTKIVLAEKVSYGFIYLDQRQVSTYSMSAHKFKIEGAIEQPRGLIHYDLATLKVCLHNRCAKIFPEQVSDGYVHKILSDTLEYYIATLQRHELFIYLLMNIMTLNRRGVIKEPIDTAITYSISVLRDYLSNLPSFPKNSSAPSMTLVIPGSDHDSQPVLRRRLSQPI